MIRTFLVASISLAALTTAAVAADLPSKVSEPEFAPSPPIPVFSWTGFYAGLHAGYQFGHDNAAIHVPALGDAFYGYSPHGIIGGGHFGYNYETAPMLGGHGLVIGLEGDIDGADYKRGVTSYGGVAGSASTSSDIKGSIRGRLGVAVDRVLFYATGGAAFADFATKYDASPTFGPGAVDLFHRSRVGYTVGGGVEYAFMNSFSVRAEYRYANYGAFTDGLTASAPGLAATVDHREIDHRVQAGISYKFDSILPAPVVVRY